MKGDMKEEEDDKPFIVQKYHPSSFPHSPLFSLMEKRKTYSVLVTSSSTVSFFGEELEIKELSSRRTFYFVDVVALVLGLNLSCHRFNHRPKREERRRRSNRRRIARRWCRSWWWKVDVSPSMKAWRHCWRVSWLKSGRAVITTEEVARGMKGQRKTGRG